MVPIPQRLLTNERENYKIQIWNRYHNKFHNKKGEKIWITQKSPARSLSMLVANKTLSQFSIAQQDFVYS